MTSRTVRMRAAQLLGPFEIFDPARIGTAHGSQLAAATPAHNGSKRQAEAAAGGGGKRQAARTGPAAGTRAAQAAGAQTDEEVPRRRGSAPQAAQQQAPAHLAASQAATRKPAAAAAAQAALQPKSVPPAAAAAAAAAAPAAAAPSEAHASSHSTGVRQLILPPSRQHTNAAMKMLQACGNRQPGSFAGPAPGAAPAALPPAGAAPAAAGLPELAPQQQAQQGAEQQAAEQQAQHVAQQQAQQVQQAAEQQASQPASMHHQTDVGSEGWAGPLQQLPAPSAPVAAQPGTPIAVLLQLASVLVDPAAGQAGLAFRELELLTAMVDAFPGQLTARLALIQEFLAQRQYAAVKALIDYAAAIHLTA